MLYVKLNAGITLGSAPYTMHVSDPSYADDAGLLDQDAPLSSDRISSIASGSTNDAAMSVSLEKTNAMHIHKQVAVSATTEMEVVEMNFSHKCSKCSRTFPTKRGLRVQKAAGVGARKIALTLERLPTSLCNVLNEKQTKRQDHKLW